MTTSAFLFSGSCLLIGFIAALVSTICFAATLLPTPYYGAAIARITTLLTVVFAFMGALVGGVGMTGYLRTGTTTPVWEAGAACAFTGTIAAAAAVFIARIM